MSKHNVRLALAAIVIALLAAACTSGVRVARDLPDDHDRSSGVVPDVGVVQAVAHPASGDPQPNIVLVLMDDFSKDLLPTMRSVRYMARHGASYDNAFVVDSLCCVSRAATFTGQYPHQTGVFTNGPTCPTLAGRWAGGARSPRTAERAAPSRSGSRSRATRPATSASTSTATRRCTATRSRRSRAGGRTSGRSSARPTTSGSSTPASRTSTASTSWSRSPHLRPPHRSGCGTGHTPAR